MFLLSENLALNKNVSKSSTEQPYTADRSVDGQTRQTLASGSCSSTQVNAFDVEAWWRVDLGELYSIGEIKIYYRNEGSKDIDITMSAFQTCFSVVCIPNTTYP